jgi:hypothetical protein
MPEATSLTVMRIHQDEVCKKSEEKKDEVTLTKGEVIDILKTLEGLKRRLQPHVR